MNKTSTLDMITRATVEFLSKNFPDNRYELGKLSGMITLARALGISEDETSNAQFAGVVSYEHDLLERNAL